MIQPQHPANIHLAGQKANGYRIQVDSISDRSDPEEISGQLVDDAEADPRPSIPFQLDTYPNFLSDPAHLQKILQELGRDSASGHRISIRYVP